MVAGYAQHDYYEEELALFFEMQSLGTRPVEVASVSIIRASASLVSLEQ